MRGLQKKNFHLVLKCAKKWGVQQRAPKKQSKNQTLVIRDAVFISSVSGNHLCDCNFVYDNCDPNVVVFWMPLMAKATNKKNNIQHALSVLTPSSCCSSFSETPRFRLHLRSLSPHFASIDYCSTIHIFPCWLLLSWSINFYIYYNSIPSWLWEDVWKKLHDKHISHVARAWPKTNGWNPNK